LSARLSVAATPEKLYDEDTKTRVLMAAGQPQVVVKIDRRAPDAHVAFLTVDNPAKLNALSSAVMDAFAAAVEQLGSDEALRVLVVTGAGNRAFIGGADIDEMARLDIASARAFITRVHRCCEALRNLPVPVIARIDGYTLGAGLELAAACDLRVATDSAQFGMPEVRLGMPSVVEAALLPTLVGWGHAREMLLLGEIVAAQEAARWGLIERVVPADGLDQAVERWIQAVLSAEPRAVRLQKMLIRKWEKLPLNDAIQAGIDCFVTAFESDGPSRAIAKFRARRKP
jgi:enoyl-CoA hydratase